MVTNIRTLIKSQVVKKIRKEKNAGCSVLYQADMRKTRKEEQIMLKIENLHKIYGKYHALSGLNMTVREGALYGFVGPNGAGKTTAIKIITGLLKAEEGSVVINGEDALEDPDKLHSCIGYVPDFFGVYDNLTVASI